LHLSGTGREKEAKRNRIKVKVRGGNQKHSESRGLQKETSIVQFQIKEEGRIVKEEATSQPKEAGSETAEKERRKLQQERKIQLYRKKD